MHPWAMHAAVDANCLAAQSPEVYWTYVDYLHAHGQEVTGEDRDINKSFAALDRIARQEGTLAKLDSSKLDACLAKQDETQVRASMKEGDKLGLDSTPSLFVDGERIIGAIPEDQVWMVIDRALRAAGEQPPAPPPRAGPREASRCEGCRKVRRLVESPHRLKSTCRRRRFLKASSPRSGRGDLSCKAGSCIRLLRRCSGCKSKLDFFSIVLPSLFSPAGCSLAALAGCHRPPSPDVMATVNGKDIMRADVEKYYKASLGDNPQEPSTEQANIVRLNILHQLIEDEILQQRAAKLNLAASDEDVNAKLTEMKAPYTQEEFDKQLKQRNITLDDLKRDLRRSLTKEKLLNKEIESKINITDAEISSYYLAHKAEFNLIEPQYHLAQIVASAVPMQQAPQSAEQQSPQRSRCEKEN